MEERRKLITTIIVAAVVVLLLAGGMLWQFRILGRWPLDHAESLKSRIAKTTQQRDRLQQKIQNELPAKRKELASYQASKELARELLPDGLSKNAINRFLREKAELSLVDVLSVGKLEPAGGRGRGLRGKGGGSPWEEYEIQLKLLGSYDQLALFINYLETFQLSNPDGSTTRRFFKIKSLTVNAEDSGRVETGRHSIDLDISTYRYKSKNGKL